MNFRITGHITEKESGLAVPNLLIRGYDRDLLYDDLLGTAATDSDGRFEMLYTEKDFRELFEARPDVYISVYAPPMRLLVETKDSVRWRAKELEHFELAIDRKTLGNLAPVLSEDEVEGGLGLAANAVTVKKRAGFDIPLIAGFTAGGAPGSPALPEQVRYVALPLGGDVLKLTVTPGEAVRLPGRVNPFPVQHPVPDVGTDPEQFRDGFSVRNTSIPFTPPDPKYFEVRETSTEDLVQLLKSEQIGPIQITAIRVRPLQFDSRDRTYIFYPNLRYRVKFDLEKARETARNRKEEKEGRIGAYRTAQLAALLDSPLVSMAKDLKWIPLPFLFEKVPHVILTDNYAWPERVLRTDGTSRPPTLTERGAAVSGDVVAEFERLAKWKTSRGVRSRVVTISEIVSGKFGDFTEGGFARDLPEVLRNFAKYIYKNWDTLYVLMAGDVNVVPMRKLTGSTTYETVGCGRTPINPPPKCQCCVLTSQSVVKLRPKFTPECTAPLSTMNGGLRIPFDREAGSGRLGWYYTNESDFTTKNEGFTRLAAGTTSQFVIVEGPPSVIDDDYYWLRDVNSIPSDFYYSSLLGPNYSIHGKHDFDCNNNELYGQTHWDSAGREVSLDGIDFWSDIWVGRASVENATEASAFVDKVLTYEKLAYPGGNVDGTYLQKILYAADYWGRYWQGLQSNPSTPPAEDTFTHVSGSNITKIHTSFDMTLSAGVPSYRLVARQATADVVFNYNTAATASNPGWFFTTADDYTTQSALPTRFIKVLGPETDINPSNAFFWDPLGLELAMAEKENMRNLMNGWYPAFSSVERHYADYFDLSSPPPIVPLDATVQTAMDEGLHFVSLSGHGSPDGCCYVSSAHDFTNKHKYFIAFANSCSTARPDLCDSLAEKSTDDADGGAIAYVGNTRYGWIGIGDNFEEFFWNKLKVVGNLGPAAGMRLTTGGVKSIWTFYTQTLFGDPETSAWTDVPAMQEVSHDPTASWGGTFTVTVRKLGVPVAGHQVTLLGGWVNSSTHPQVFLTKVTNSMGQASFTLPSTGEPPSEILVTVTRRNFKPYQSAVAVAAMRVKAVA